MVNSLFRCIVTISRNQQKRDRILRIKDANDSKDRIAEEAVHHGIDLTIQSVGKKAEHWMFDAVGVRLVDYWPTTGCCRIGKVQSALVSGPDEALKLAITEEKRSPAVSQASMEYAAFPNGIRSGPSNQ